MTVLTICTDRQRCGKKYHKDEACEAEVLRFVKNHLDRINHPAGSMKDLGVKGTLEERLEALRLFTLLVSTEDPIQCLRDVKSREREDLRRVLVNQLRASGSLGLKYVSVTGEVTNTKFQRILDLVITQYYIAG